MIFRIDRRPTCQIRAELRHHQEVLVGYRKDLESAISLSKEFDLSHRQTALAFELKVEHIRHNVERRQEVVYRDEKILRWRQWTEF